MKVYPVAFGGIANSKPIQGFMTSAAQSMEEVAIKGKDIATEIAEEILSYQGKGDDVLNYLYKHLPVGTEKKLENFDGRRKISVFRGKDYMNKITQRLETPPLTFIRSMENAGTNENPKLVTKAVSLRVPNKPEEVMIHFLDEPQRQLFLRVTRAGFEPHRALYDSWADLRKDQIFQKVVTIMTGKEF